MYLLDTDVLSALRRRERNQAVTSWYDQQRESELHISVVTIGEVEKGISQELNRDAEFAETLTRWLSRILRAYSSRILDIDLPTARRWGRLSAALGNRNTDLFIAATALEHDLIVVTRNVRHFEPTGVRLVNPFDV